METSPLLLNVAFVVLYWALGAFGRDLFYNHNVNADLTDDKIGAILPYLRVTACAATAMCVAYVSGLRWSLERIPLSLAPFCLWTLLTIVWTESTKDSLRASLTLIAAWGAVPILMHRLGPIRSVHLILRGMIAVCIASVFFAIFVPSLGQHNAADLVQSSHEGRWRGIFSHKNGLGPWAAYGATLPVLYGGDAFRWPLRIVGSLGGILCLVNSGSATGLALAGVIIILHLMFRVLRPGRTGISLLFGAMALFAAALVIAMFFQESLNLLGRSDDLSGRRAIWSLSWDFVRASPWWGYGYGTLGGGDFLGREASVFAEAIPGPESGFLNLLLESGFIGAALLAIAYLNALIKGFSWRHGSTGADKRAIEVYLIILISTLVEAFSESNAFLVTGFQGVIFFASLFGLSTARPSRAVRKVASTRTMLMKKSVVSGAQINDSALG